jgi:hypothetical protein
MKVRPRRLLRRVNVGLVLGLMALVIALFAVIRAVDSPLVRHGTDLWIVASFAVIITLGELNRIQLAGARESAPMSLAAAFAFAMTSEVGVGYNVTFDADVVISVTAVAMLLGAAGFIGRGAMVRIDDMAARFISVAVAAALFRQVLEWQGHSLLDLQAEWSQDRWRSAFSMLGVSAVALLAQGILVAVSAAVRARLPVWQSIVDELREAVGLSTALAASGALIALAERPMGIIALPIFLVPLVLTQFAVRRFARVRATYRQTIRTLSRLTEIGGYTPPDHPARVAELSVAMGRDMGMSERDALELEYAALLHDIGQVALREPIPGGATMLAAPADQDRIARDGAEIVRKTGVLDTVAVILESQSRPYRHVRELGEELPISSRIIKVANAYDDLVGENGDADHEGAAIERIHLGLGYEYDPRVVEALVRVLARRSLT